MQAYTYSLVDILKPERRFIIPTFQRDYEWTREGQWQLLFEDLDTVTERLGNARRFATQSNVAPSKAEDKVAPHFLGAIVCDNLPFPTGGVALRAVVDGQQRLTTLQLLIRGVLDVLIERGSPRVGSVRRMLRNPDDVVGSAEEAHKLWPRRDDRRVWPEAMQDALPVETSANLQHLYLQARKFFADQARKTTVDLISGEPDAERLDAMVDALMGLFKLVVIDLDENDDAQVIFEVLNGRQTDLSAIDLVKNLLFLRGELHSDDVEQLYDHYWSGFDHPWWKTAVGTGHAQRGRRDVLLSVWLTAVTRDEVNVGRLYREVREYLKAENPKTETVLQELHAYALAYQEIYGQLEVETATHRTAYDRVITLNNTTAIPLLAWLRTLPVGQLSGEDHLRAVRAVESWTLRCMLVGSNTRGYGTHFTRVLREAYEAAERGDNVADAIVSALMSGQLGWPSDSDVQNAFLTVKYYNNFTQERIRLLLSAIDRQLHDENPKAEPASFDYHALQIEHVMPRSWQTHWPLPDGAAYSPATAAIDPALAAAASARSQAIDRIGNLTLVTGTFNQSVSNHSWDEKRPEFAGQSSLQLNKVLGAAPHWDEGSIDARAIRLAQVAQAVWPNAQVLGYVAPTPAS